MPFCIGWVENVDEITLFCTVKASLCFCVMVKEIKANLCFTIFGKNLKLQNGRHFRGGEIFF